MAPSLVFDESSRIGRHASRGCKCCPKVLQQARKSAPNRQGPNGKAELEQAIGRVRRTRRPSLDTLAALAQEAGDLPCQPPEERQFKLLVTQFSEWQVASDATVVSRNWQIQRSINLPDVQQELLAEGDIPAFTQCLHLRWDPPFFNAYR